MVASKVSGVHPRLHRRWFFADCIFDEANWVLTVGGERVAVEFKPLELLRQLLLRSGELVSKEELLDTIWPDVIVVEASLPTAVRKLRSALNDDNRNARIIETVARIGYRLGVPADVENMVTSASSSAVAARPSPPAGDVLATWQGYGASNKAKAIRHLFSAPITGILIVAITSTAIAFGHSRSAAEQRGATSYSQREVFIALRKLDVGAVEDMLAVGWDPNTPLDAQGNDAVKMVLNICEWDRDHDRSQLLLLVRTLVDGGARLDHRNSWGDTAYSIARAQRYCGPSHPVTNSLRTMCYAGFKPPADRCLATYEIERRRR